MQSIHLMSLGEGVDVLTSQSALRTVWGCADKEGPEVLGHTRVVGRAEGAPHAMDISMQLDITDLFGLDLRLSFSVCFDLVAGCADESSPLLEAIYVLSV